MIKIKNEVELLSLLKIISSEAVVVSKRINENADPTTKDYLSRYKQDEEMFGNLSEQEDEAEDEEDEEAEEAELETQPEDKEATEEDFVDDGVSFDSITRAINTLRSGKSLKDSGIKKQAADYYDKLSDAERKALFVFLEAFSDIISGQVQGKEAQDPSEPPVSISFQGQEEEPAEEPTEEPAETQDKEPNEEDQEDTTPPIRVNESQDLSSLRRKFRRMMLRG